MNIINYNTVFITFFFQGDGPCRSVRVISEEDTNSTIDPPVFHPSNTVDRQVPNKK